MSCPVTSFPCPTISLLCFYYIPPVFQDAPSSPPLVLMPASYSTVSVYFSSCTVLPPSESLCSTLIHVSCESTDFLSLPRPSCVLFPFHPHSSLSHLLLPSIQNSQVFEALEFQPPKHHRDWWHLHCIHDRWTRTWHLIVFGSAFKLAIDQRASGVLSWGIL